jgi:NAD(P)H-flavin reductase
MPDQTNQGANNAGQPASAASVTVSPCPPVPLSPYCPEPAVIRAVEPETPGVATFRLELQDARRQATFRYEPGQFNMLFVFGLGEVAISISSTPEEQPGIGHTIRFVGMVTRALERLRPGDVLGLRGPYGKGWPLEQARGQDVLVVAGGLGLAPLRPLIRALLARRREFGRLLLLYGSRQPADLLYQREHAAWQQQGLEMRVTVDCADAAWGGRVGVVPALLGRVSFDPARTIAFTCGPEIMMRFTVYELLSRRLPPERIYLSVERNMQCGVGLCGRCQIGPYFVCKDGPVFSFQRLGRFVQQEHF